MWEGRPQSCALDGGTEREKVSFVPVAPSHLSPDGLPSSSERVLTPAFSNLCSEAPWRPDNLPPFVIGIFFFSWGAFLGEVPVSCGENSNTPSFPTEGSSRTLSLNSANVSHSIQCPMEYTWFLLSRALGSSSSPQWSKLSSFA